MRRTTADLLTVNAATIRLFGRGAAGRTEPKDERARVSLIRINAGRLRRVREGCPARRMAAPSEA